MYYFSYFFLILCYTPGSLADSKNIFYDHDAVNPLSSYKSYLIFSNKKREFKKRQKRILNLRQRNLKSKSLLEKNKAYDWDFLNNVQTKHSKPVLRFSQSDRLSHLERDFFAHQKRQKIFAKKRTKNFSLYKKKHREYKQRQKNILEERLKAISADRGKRKNHRIPVF